MVSAVARKKRWIMMMSLTDFIKFGGETGGQSTGNRNSSLGLSEDRGFSHLRLKG